MMIVKALLIDRASSFQNCGVPRLQFLIWESHLQIQIIPKNFDSFQSWFAHFLSRVSAQTPGHATVSNEIASNCASVI